MVALIRERVLGTTEEAGLRAAYRVTEAIRDVGHSSSVTFDDPFIHYVIEKLGGWEELCAMTSEEWKFARKDFARLYDAALQEKIDFDKVPARLPGMVERTNFATGNEEYGFPVRMIGDHKKILAWTNRRALLPGLEDMTAPNVGIPRLRFTVKGAKGPPRGSGEEGNESGV